MFSLRVDRVAQESEETFMISFSSTILDTDAMILEGRILDSDGISFRWIWKHAVGLYPILLSSNIPILLYALMTGLMEYQTIKYMKGSGIRDLDFPQTSTIQLCICTCTYVDVRTCNLVHLIHID